MKKSTCLLDIFAHYSGAVDMCSAMSVMGRVCTLLDLVTHGLLGFLSKIEKHPESNDSSVSQALEHIHPILN